MTRTRRRIGGPTDYRKLPRRCGWHPRMQEALSVTGGVQKRAAELISMPLRTFTMKYKQYGPRDR